MKKLMRCLWILALLFTAHCSFAAVTTDNIKFAAPVQLTGSGINSLAASATSCYAMAAVDNTSTLYVDDYVTVVSSMSNSALAGHFVMNYYVAGSDGTDPYDQDDAVISGSAGNYTINATTNLKPAASVAVLTAGKQYVKSFYITPLFGNMPAKYVIVVCNDTGQTTAASGNAIYHSGVTFTNQ